MSEPLKQKSVKPVKPVHSDSFDIFSREDVIDWEKLEETLKDLTFKDTYKNTFKDTCKDTHKK